MTSEAELPTEVGTGNEAPRGRRILEWLTAAHIVMVGLLLLAEWVVAEHTWPTTVVTYMPQQPFAIPGVLLVIWACVRRRWLLWSVNLLCLAVIAFGLLGLRLPPGKHSGVGRTIRVMAYNVHGVRGGVDRVAQVVRAQSPDIVVLEESGLEHGKGPGAALLARFPGWNYALSGDVVILTPHTTTYWALHQMANVPRQVLEVTVDIRGRKITVLGVHLATAMPGHSLISRSSSLPSYLHETYATRRSQVDAILGIAGAATPPVIIAGDFNTPPRGLIYRDLTAQYIDAFDSTGRGRGLSYPAKFPLVRIDYILVGPGLDPVDCYVPNTRASDHRPVVADLAVGQ